MPQSNQHNISPTSGKVVDAFTTTRWMDGNIGSKTDPATWTTIPTNATTSQQTLYYHRLASLPLALEASGIAAQTWDYVFNVWTSHVDINYPVSGSNQTIPINCYVWRPSTQTKVGTIRQGASNSDVSEPSQGGDRTIVGSFAGSAVGSLLDGDVIIFEVWFQISQSSSTPYTTYYSMDGPNISTTFNEDNTSPATWIETPQDIFEYVPPVSMTNQWTKTLNNKFITSI